jgi:hypothetical protein
VTGISLLGGVLDAKRLDLALQLVPGATTVAVLIIRRTWIQLVSEQLLSAAQSRASWCRWVDRVETRKRGLLRQPGTAPPLSLWRRLSGLLLPRCPRSEPTSNSVRGFVNPPVWEAFLLVLVAAVPGRRGQAVLVPYNTGVSCGEPLARARR